MASVPTTTFYGTAQTCVNSSTDIAAGNFGGAPAATYDNTTDSAVPNAPFAEFMIEMPDWGAAPAAGTFVALYGVNKDVDGTDDDTDAPSSTAVNGAFFIASFPIAAVDALQRRTRVASTLGWKKVDIYVYNGTAQNMNNDGGTNLVLKVTPLSPGVTV